MNLPATVARDARNNSVMQDDARVPLSMTVNDRLCAMTLEPRMTLLDALRDELGLTPAASSIPRPLEVRPSVGSYGAWGKRCSSSRRPIPSSAASSTATIPAISYRRMRIFRSSRRSSWRLQRGSEPARRQGPRGACCRISGAGDRERRVSRDRQASA